MDVYARHDLRYPKERYAEALQKHGGLLSPTARFLKVSLSVLGTALRRWPSLVDVQQEARSAALDDTEWALVRAAREGEPWAVQYYLRHQGKDRGYAESKGQDQTHTFRVEVSYTEDALGATRPVTTITPVSQLPPPPGDGAPKRRRKKDAPAEAPQIEVVEAEVTYPDAAPSPAEPELQEVVGA